MPCIILAHLLFLEHFPLLTARRIAIYAQVSAFPVVPSSPPLLPPLPPPLSPPPPPPSFVQGRWEMADGAARLQACTSNGCIRRVALGLHLRAPKWRRQQRDRIVIPDSCFPPVARPVGLVRGAW